MVDLNFKILCIVVEKVIDIVKFILDDLYNGIVDKELFEFVLFDLDLYYLWEVSLE